MKSELVIWGKAFFLSAILRYCVRRVKLACKCYRVMITCTERGDLCFWPPDSEKVSEFIYNLMATNLKSTSTDHYYIFDFTFSDTRTILNHPLTDFSNVCSCAQFFKSMRKNNIHGCYSFIL